MEDYNQTSKCNDLQMNQRGMSNHTHLQQFHKCGFQEAEYGTMYMYQNWTPVLVTFLPVLANSTRSRA